MSAGNLIVFNSPKTSPRCVWIWKFSLTEDCEYIPLILWHSNIFSIVKSSSLGVRGKSVRIFSSLRTFLDVAISLSLSLAGNCSLKPSATFLFHRRDGFNGGWVAAWCSAVVVVHLLTFGLFYDWTLSSLGGRILAILDKKISILWELSWQMENFL